MRLSEGPVELLSVGKNAGDAKPLASILRLDFDFPVVKANTNSGLESTTLLSIYYNSEAVPFNASAGDSKVAVPRPTRREHSSLLPFPHDVLQLRLGIQH